MTVLKRAQVNRPLRDWAQADKDQDKENKVPVDEPPREYNYIKTC